MERSGREICEQAGGSDQAWQQKKRWSEVVGCVASSMVGPTSFASGLVFIAVRALSLVVTSHIYSLVVVCELLTVLVFPAVKHGL